MERLSFRNMAWSLLFVALALQTGNAQLGPSEFGTSGMKTCDQLRQDTVKAFQTAFESKVPANLLKEMLLSAWKDSLLPHRCHKKVEGPFNPSSHNDHVGPLGMVSGPSTIYTTSILDESVAVTNRHKRSASGEETRPKDESPKSKVEKTTPKVRSKRFISDLSGLFPGMSMSSMSYGGMGGMGGPPGGKEMSESARMMKTWLLISKLGKQRAQRAVKAATSGVSSYNGDKYNIGSGMYGDAYPGKRRRRRSTESVVGNIDGITSDQKISQPWSDKASSSPRLSRKKRFLFMGEPGDAPSAGPPMPSFLSILMGTARDPNSGKKIEFGGDYMKNMMRSSFMAAVPGLAGSTPPGKEPPDMVKALAPIWYFSRVQQAMAPRRRPLAMDNYIHNGGMRNSYNYRNPASTKSRNRDGFYGDSLPMHGRRWRRSTDTVRDFLADTADATVHKRSKRAAGEGGNDVITIGDISIPTEFFKPPERSEEYKHYRGYRKPDDYRYYNHYSQPQQRYYSPQPSQYQQQQQQRQMQQQQQRFYQQYRHLYSLYIQALRGQRSHNQAPPATNTWTRPVATNAPPPTQRQAPPQNFNVAPHVPPRPAQAPPPMTQQAPPPTSYSYYQGPLTPPQNSYAPPPPQHSPPLNYYAQSQPSAQYYPQPQYTQQNYYLDPFIPNPPTPPPIITTPPPSRKKRSVDDHQLSRRKRSEDNDKGSDTSSRPFFFPQIPFFRQSPSIFSPFFNRYSVPTLNKVGYSQPQGGGIIYGDRLPWASRSKPRKLWGQPKSSASPLLRSSAAQSPSIPRLVPASAHVHRRVKRSDSNNNDNPDYSTPMFFYTPSWFSPFQQVPRLYNKPVISVGNSGRVYGDRMPWAAQSSMGQSTLTTNPYSATRNPRGPLDHLLAAGSRRSSQRG